MDISKYQFILTVLNWQGMTLWNLYVLLSRAWILVVCFKIWNYAKIKIIKKNLNLSLGTLDQEDNKLEQVPI